MKEKKENTSNINLFVKVLCILVAILFLSAFTAGLVTYDYDNKLQIEKQKYDNLMDLCSNKISDLKFNLSVCNNARDQFKMYYEDKYNKPFEAIDGVKGLAYGDYIVVWTKDKTITEVLNTCTHEYAHNELGLKD